MRAVEVVHNSFHFFLPIFRPTTTEAVKELEFNSFDVVVPSTSPVPLVSETFQPAFKPAFEPASPSPPKFENPLVPAIIPVSNPSTLGPVPIPGKLCRNEFQASRQSQ